MFGWFVSMSDSESNSSKVTPEILQTKRCVTHWLRNLLRLLFQFSATVTILSGILMVWCKWLLSTEICKSACEMCIKYKVVWESGMFYPGSALPVVENIYLQPCASLSLSIYHLYSTGIEKLYYCGQVCKLTNLYLTLKSVTWIFLNLLAGICVCLYKIEGFIVCFYSVSSCTSLLNSLTDLVLIWYDMDVTIFALFVVNWFTVQSFCRHHIH